MQKIKQFIQNSNVLKNASLSMIGSILIRAVDLISIPIFTRILDTTVYGRVSVFTTCPDLYHYSQFGFSWMRGKSDAGV